MYTYTLSLHLQVGAIAPLPNLKTTCPKSIAAATVVWTCAGSGTRWVTQATCRLLFTKHSLLEANYYDMKIYRPAQLADIGGDERVLHGIKLLPQWALLLQQPQHAAQR